ncbi:uncharacterized protein LOC112558602 isoform X2 [Pomacea canaliculata]|nr:uncharacterized protein LOC112558602 isoform X2 [Pomacea canaliculata]
MRESGATVNKVLRALKVMQREDALQILLDAVPDIEQKYLDLQHESELAHAVEIDEKYMSPLGCQCPNSSAPFSSQHCSSPCSSYRHHHSPCSHLSTSCCCHHHPDHHQPPHRFNTPFRVPPTSTHHHQQAPLTITTASIQPSLGANRAGPLDLKYNIMSDHTNANHLTPIMSDHTNPNLLTPMSELSNYDHVPQQADPSISVSNSKKSPLFHPQYMPPVNNSFGHRQLSDSMAVQPDTDRNEGVLCSFSSDVEMEGNAVREKPASLPAAIARGLGHVSMAFNGQPLVGPIGMDIGEEEGSSTSSNDCSSTGSGYQLNTAARAAGTSPGHHNIERQVSEECNMKQPYSARDAMQRVRTWDITQPAMVDPHGASSRWTSVDKCNNNGSVGRPTGAAGRVGCDKEQPTSLQQLVKLSKLPDHYMPDTKYKTIVADQQIDELPNGKAIQGIKQETTGVQSSCLYGNRSASSKGAVSSTSSGSNNSQVWVTQRGENPNTFPMRVKSQSGGATVEKVRKLKPGQLTKTVSVPMDMKMEEFKKAFRHIKVFVTYANDSKQHSHQVLSLCNCLDRNGFSCCVDVYSQRESNPEEKQASRDWCTRKFREADFILVCLSPQYVREIQMVSKASDANSQTWQHAAHIYHLMQQEYERTRRTSRFVPLFFEGLKLEGTPSWLTHHLVYHWPQQYKDLLWMLTKPEERIKPRSKAEKNCSMLKNGHCMPVLSSSGY